MKKTSDAQLKANAKYAKKNTVFKAVQLNKKTDALILEYLENIDNFQGYVKSLIRKDMEEKGVIQREQGD